MENELMLKAFSNSKLFFVALGVTIALVGMRVSAAPSQPKSAADSLEKSVARIADSLETIQRDGLKVKVSQDWGGDPLKVKIQQ